MNPERQKLLFVLSMDTEEEWDWDGPFPDQHAAVSNINELPAFHAFCQELGIRPTYFTDYAVVSNRASIDILKAIVDQQDSEIGAHLHPWVNPPFFGVTGERESHVVNLPIEQVKAKLEALIKTFKTELDVEPAAFRSGRWGINGECLQLLLENGITIDSSVYPFFKNSYFNCETAPVLPYWPDFDDTNRASTQRDIVEIPVTAGFNRPSFYRLNRLHNLVINPPFSWLRINAMLWHSNLLRKIYLSPELHSSADMISLVKACLKTGHNLFHMNLHSSSLIEGVTGLTQVANARESICRRIAEVVTFLEESHEIEFCTISEASRKLGVGTEKQSEKDSPKK
jgi:hypothetical protein